MTPPRSRRLVAEDSFRVQKIVLGLVMIAIAAFVMWNTTWNALDCTGTSCVIRQEHPLQSTRAFPFDTAEAPTVVVESATSGKRQTAKVLLRYESGAEVEISRDGPDTANATAAQVRAYFAHPVGSFSVHEPHDPFSLWITGFVALLGCLMFLDGATLLGWRRVRTDGSGREVVIDHVVLGLRVKHAVFPMSPTTTLGREQVVPHNLHFHWLTFEEPGAPAKRLPLLDRPRNRAAIEEALGKR